MTQMFHRFFSQVLGIKFISNVSVSRRSCQLLTTHLTIERRPTRWRRKYPPVGKSSHQFFVRAWGYHSRLPPTMLSGFVS